ncbi:hypothetical protein DEO23_14175 [Brachybacterium endophyticum]|uniref:Uncharacterized protein n=1 Tax=Brachybacterium endophyticum TaxID=2182385 RepID=A0A2U2RH73_9MICO|nr:hypothetical protein [Brachybacterium endophyticum]PWH05223.1 hypothetical protein DEO23_14175 [Brachybacterium endophyticum]
MTKPDDPRPTLMDRITSRPIYDQAPAIVAAAAWAFWGVGALGLDDPALSSQRAAIYTSLGTLSALVLASATFVCTMTYQSTNMLMNAAFKKFRPEIRRNWLSILATALVAAAVSVSLLATDSLSPRWSLVVGGYILAIILIRGLRALYWLNYSLFGDELDGARRKKVELEGVPLLKDKSDATR